MSTSFSSLCFQSLETLQQHVILARLREVQPKIQRVLSGRLLQGVRLVQILTENGSTKKGRLLPTMVGR